MDFKKQMMEGNFFQEKNSSQEKSPKKIIKFLDLIITISLSAIFFGVPLFFTNLTLQGTSFEKQMYFYFWILIALVCWASKGVISGEMKIKRTPLDIPLVIFWVACGISLFFSVDRWHSFFGFFGDPSRGFMSITALIFLYYLIVSHFDKKKFLLMLGFLIASDFVLVVLAMLNFFGSANVIEKIGKYITLSPIGSLTGLGIFLSAMLPILVMFIIHLFSENQKTSQKRNYLAGFLFLSLILNLFVLLVLYSFVSWIAVLVGVSFFLIYILAQMVRPARNWSFVPMLVFVAILAILMIGNNSISKNQLPVEVSPSYQMSWSIAKESLKDNFLIGSGLATYGYDFSLHRPQEFNSNQYYNLRFLQGSGLLFESLPTIGVVGSIALVLLVLTFLSIGIYLLGIDKKKNKLYSLGIFSSSLVVIVSAFGGKIEGSLIIFSVLILSLAVAMLLDESEAEENFTALSLKASPKYALALAFVFMVISAGVVFLLIFLGKVYMADIKAGSAIREQKVSQEGSVKKLNEAIGLNNKESRYHILMGQQLMSLANEQTLKGEKDRNLSLIQNYLNSSIALVDSAQKMSPKDISAEESLAQIYENSGLYVADSFALAEDHYKKSIELEPHNPIYFLKIGQIKMAEASNKKSKDEIMVVVQEASDWFTKAINEKKDLASAYYQQALAKEVLGQLDEAVKNIEQAAILEQSNLNYIYNTARIHQARGNADDMKISETIYKNILSKNEKEINTLFSYGLLLEKTKRNTEAVTQYKKVLEILPENSSEVKAKVQKMISNINAGIENKPENVNNEPIAQTEIAPAPENGESAVAPAQP